MQCLTRELKASDASDLPDVPADLVYNSLGMYATIDLCGQIFVGAGRTWRTLEAGRLPAYCDANEENDAVSALADLIIAAHRTANRAIVELKKRQAGKPEGLEIMEFMPGELPADWDDDIDLVAGDDVEEVVLLHGDSSEPMNLKGAKVDGKDPQEEAAS